MRDFLKQERFSYEEVEVLTGRLTHVSYLLPQLRCYLSSLHRWKSAWMVRFAKQRLPADVEEDLEYWLTTLTSFKNLRLIPTVTPKEIRWVGDTSTSFGIGVLIGRFWCQLRLKQGWEQSGPVRKGIAWLETVAIRIGILMLAQLKQAKGQNLVVWTDNTTCEATLRKRKSKDRAVNEEWKLIQKLLIELQIDITPKRVISEENEADSLSRGVNIRHDERDRLHLILPIDLLPVLEITQANVICNKEP